MKISTKINFILFASCFLFGCKEEIKDDLNNPSLHYLYIKSTENPKTIISNGDKISFTSEGGTSLTYKVEADGEYKISKEPNDTWCTINLSKENNTFYLTATANPTKKVREEKITISLIGFHTDKSLNKDIIVRQSIGYESVDLGLPSGLKWATCNVGASYPEEYGDYFAWGGDLHKE